MKVGDGELRIRDPESPTIQQTEPFPNSSRFLPSVRLPNGKLPPNGSGRSRSWPALIAATLLASTETSAERKSRYKCDFRLNLKGSSNISHSSFRGSNSGSLWISIKSFPFAVAAIHASATEV